MLFYRRVIMARFKEYQTKLQTLYGVQDDLINQYNELSDGAGCLSCASYSTGASFDGRHKNCGDCDKAAELKKLAVEVDKAGADIDKYIEDEYAVAVFAYYNKKKPELVRVRTDETYTWEDAFGSDFTKYDKALKHSLVGLVENTGRFKIK